MKTQQIVGLAFLLAGIAEPLIGLYLIGPRVPDPRTRKIITVVLALSGVVLIVLGTAFFMGVIPLEA